MICLLCVCSRVFIRSLISRHNGLWLCAAALLVNSELPELFIFERSVNQAPLPAEDQEGNQGGGEEGSVNELL